MDIVGQFRGVFPRTRLARLAVFRSPGHHSPVTDNRLRKLGPAYDGNDVHEYAEELADAAPELTAEQIARLRRLFTGGPNPRVPAPDVRG